MLKARRVGTPIPAQYIKRARDLYERRLGFMPSRELPRRGFARRLAEPATLRAAVTITTPSGSSVAR